jgi:hypothetical protein
MISRKMKRLSAVVGPGAFFALAAIAYTIHKGAAPAGQIYDPAVGASTFDGRDGKLIGAAPNPSIGSQLQRDGLPE